MDESDYSGRKLKDFRANELTDQPEVPSRSAFRKAQETQPQKPTKGQKDGDNIPQKPKEEGENEPGTPNKLPGGKIFHRMTSVKSKHGSSLSAVNQHLDLHSGIGNKDNESVGYGSVKFQIETEKVLDSQNNVIGAGGDKQPAAPRINPFKALLNGFARTKSNKSKATSGMSGASGAKTSERSVLFDPLQFGGTVEHIVHSKPVFSARYLSRRRSNGMLPISDARIDGEGQANRPANKQTQSPGLPPRGGVDHELQPHQGSPQADDMMVGPFGGRSFFKRSTAVATAKNQSGEKLNVVLCEVMAKPDFKEFISNKKTLEYLNLYISKFSKMNQGQGLKAFLTHGIQPAHTIVEKPVSSPKLDEQAGFGSTPNSPDELKGANDGIPTPVSATPLQRRNSRRLGQNQTHIESESPKLFKFQRARTRFDGGPESNEDELRLMGKPPSQPGSQASLSPQGTLKLNHQTKSIRPDNTFTQAMKTQDLMERLNAYVPIVLFLALHLGQTEVGTKLLYYDSLLMQETGIKDCQKLLENEYFISKLVGGVVKFEEDRIFHMVLKAIQSWDLLLSQTLLNTYMIPDKIELMVEILKKLNKHLTSDKKLMQKSVSHMSGAQGRPNPPSLGSKSGERLVTEEQILQTNGVVVGMKPPGSGHPSQTLKQPIQLPSFEPKQTGTVPESVGISTSRTLISKDKMRLIVRKYFECAKNPKLIVDLLRNLGFNDEDSIDFIMSTEDEEKVLEIVREDKKLRDKLDIPKLVSLQMFQVLLCYEPNDLINRLNASSIPNKARGTSVYNAMCDLIKAGKKIQSICFILMYVSVTFWDFDKIWLMYQSLNEILRYESKSNWLSELDNPLLFCMKLADFFKSIDSVLSINSKEIIKLTEDLVQFCICYITNCQQESLILDLFDKDSHGMDFLEYSFTVKQIEVFNIEYVTKVIDNLWDLGRQSKQSLNSFFRFAVFDKEIRKFDWKIFIRDYTMPMEVGEKFQLDYYLTNRSVYLKVMAEIIWPYLQVGFEFFFSMQIIWMYLGEYEASFDHEMSWLKIYTEDYPVLSVVHIYLRSAYILSLLVKSLLLSNVSRRSFYLQYFYYAIISFMILQMAIYPIFFPDNFWILSNLQMLIVISMMSYSLYLGLSLKSGGVVLRIFARMVYVVLLFGTASLLVISIVAFPIHTAYIGYTEIAPSGQQLNLFQSFYTGILTLFEFTFGAVVFVRPYVELNFTTISITVVMVFFSFFGNIMLANMLVAFLTNQFDVITAGAKYYTLRMQFNIIRTLSLKNVDSAFTMPFFLMPFCLPIYLMMFGSLKTRKSANNLLKKVVHILNVVIPWSLYYLCYLAGEVFTRFFEVFWLTLEDAGSKVLGFASILAWLVVGPFLLLKLLFQDMWLVFKRTLNFKDTSDDDLFIITLTEEERIKYVEFFEKIYLVAVRSVHAYLKQKEKPVIYLNKFLFDLRLAYPDDFKPRFKKPKDSNDVAEANNADSEEDEEEPADGMTLKTVYNKNKFMFRRKYDVDSGSRLLEIVLNKYASFDDRIITGKGNPNKELDLEFLVRKLKNNLNPSSVHVLLTFDKKTLELARKEFNKEEEIQIRNDIITIKSRLDDLQKDLHKSIKQLSTYRTIGQVY